MIEALGPRSFVSGLRRVRARWTRFSDDSQQGQNEWFLKISWTLTLHDVTH